LATFQRAEPVAPPHHPATTTVRRAVIERATVREILMGAQDNLTTVLAVMLGVSIGSGRADLVALAGLSAAVAEAVSMGGVLYSSTRAEGILEAHARTDRPGTPRATLAPAQSGLVTFVAALLAGLVPLAPFAVLPLHAAIIVSVAASGIALFLLGSVIGRISGSTWWRDGFRLLVVAGLAAGASAAVGATLSIR
jgi:VIT1/CCC1 family predicted Fe2+/Mn2+ transporter